MILMQANNQCANRHYEPWLEPLRAALGPVLETYPSVPVFAAADGQD